MSIMTDAGRRGGDIGAPIGCATVPTADRNRLILWDIDGTLVANAGIGTDAFRAAFAKLTGAEPDRLPDMAGRTERWILSASLALNGFEESPGDFDRFIPLEAEAYADRAGELQARGRVLPGVVELLSTLSGRPDVVQTVLTGNTRAVSAIKLDAYGLSSWLRLDLGAYADDHDQRPNLVPIALDRAGGLPAADCVVVGDTVHDVAAGKAHGTTVVAVSTGAFDGPTLGGAGADHVFTDLSATDTVLAALLG